MKHGIIDTPEEHEAYRREVERRTDDPDELINIFAYGMLPTLAFCGAVVVVIVLVNLINLTKPAGL